MKEIDGFPGYFVTREGKVYSNRKWRGNLKGELRELSQRTDGKGYYLINLGRDRKCFLVHRLVALAYIPNPDNLPQVNHINEDKSDNRIENLEWISSHHNTLYSQAKLYTIEHKNGDKFEVFGLRKWCRENNMKINRLNETFKGIRRKWYKDHRLVSIRELSQEERRAHLQDAMISETSKDSRRVSA